MDSNMVKPEKFDHLYIVYYFTAPLKDILKSLKAIFQSFFQCDENILGRVCSKAKPKDTLRTYM